MGAAVILGAEKVVLTDRLIPPSVQQLDALQDVGGADDVDEAWASVGASAAAGGPTGSGRGRADLLDALRSNVAANAAALGPGCVSDLLLTMRRCECGVSTYRQ